MTVRTVFRRASIGINFGHFNNVFLDMLAINVVQMSMVQIIKMVSMPNGGVATAWTMNVRTCTSRFISAGHWGAFPFCCVATVQSHHVSGEQFSGWLRGDTRGA